MVWYCLLAVVARLRGWVSGFFLCLGLLLGWCVCSRLDFVILAFSSVLSWWVDIRFAGCFPVFCLWGCGMSLGWLRGSADFGFWVCEWCAVVWSFGCLFAGWFLVCWSPVCGVLFDLVVCAAWVRGCGVFAVLSLLGGCGLVFVVRLRTGVLVCRLLGYGTDDSGLWILMVILVGLVVSGFRTLGLLLIAGCGFLGCGVGCLGLSLGLFGFVSVGCGWWF